MKQISVISKGQQANTNNQQTRAWLLVGLMSVIVLFGLYQLWQAWPRLVIETAHWQREANAQLADILYDAQENSIMAGVYLVGFSFLYGMLHSLGPGHGKVIVSTYLATHPTKVKASLVITVVSAFVQALVAITLVSVLVWGFSASMRAVNDKAMQFVSLSFALVALLGGLIVYKALKLIYRALRAPKSHISTLKPLAAEGNVPIGVSSPLNHQHSAQCGCGHNHVAETDAINKASTWREYVTIVTSIGIRPCTGAIMVLLFANIAGLYWMGVLSALMMAVGTALTTSVIAMMTLTGKHLVKRYMASGKGVGKNWRLAGAYVQLLGGILLIVMGLLFMSGGNYGMSPIFAV